MDKLIRKSVFLLAIFGLIACKSSGGLAAYEPNEFTLLIATSNHGEVGPCG